MVDVHFGQYHLRLKLCQAVDAVLMWPGHTVTLSFRPSTTNNSLFHCHFAFHADETVTLSGGVNEGA